VTARHLLGRLRERRLRLGVNEAYVASWAHVDVQEVLNSERGIMPGPDIADRIDAALCLLEERGT
jgi:hypothetical protein